MSDFNFGDHSKNLSTARTLEVLEKGKVDKEHGIMRWSSNYTFLISLSYDNDRLLSVYKPQKGERPLWDFPDGTLCKREVASFLTSEALKWSLVPPTVLRDGPRGLGSVQLYIEHDSEINYFSFDETIVPQLMKLAAFDYIVNNADRKGGHCLLDSAGHLWGIDHGITFHTAPKLRTVIWDFAGQPIPDSILEDLDGLCDQLTDVNNPYRAQLATYISEREITAFQSRVRELVRSRKYPQPGNGPNYPWPPV
jgi:hypothetical protein